MSFSDSLSYIIIHPPTNIGIQISYSKDVYFNIHEVSPMGVMIRHNGGLQLETLLLLCNQSLARQGFPDFNNFGTAP